MQKGDLGETVAGWGGRKPVGKRELQNKFIARLIWSGRSEGNGLDADISRLSNRKVSIQLCPTRMNTDAVGIITRQAKVRVLDGLLANLEVRQGAEPGVEDVAQRIGPEGDGDPRGHDGHPRPPGDPPAAQEIVAPVAQVHTPLGGGWT